MEDTKAKNMIPLHYGLFTDVEVHSKVLIKCITQVLKTKEVKILKVGDQFPIKELTQD
jgi:L-ascorbate metabolism protein UlaG (beta-lactamase superfamily)